MSLPFAMLYPAKLPGVRVEDRQRDVLELERDVREPVIREWLDLTRDRDRRELADPALEVDLGVRVGIGRHARDDAFERADVGRKVGLDEVIREVHAARFDAHFANADRHAGLGQHRRWLGGLAAAPSARPSSAPSCGRAVCRSACAASLAACASWSLRACKAAAVPTGSSTAATLRTWSDRVDDPGEWLVHEHALDRQRIGREREADLRASSSVDVEEFFLERVVHRAQRAHRRIARIAQLRVLAAGGMHLEATGCRDLAGANRQVRASHEIRLQTLEFEPLERNLECRRERLGHHVARCRECRRGAVDLCRRA